MKAIMIIAQLTFREAMRRRVILTAVIVGLLFLILFSVGFGLLNQEMARTSSKDMFGVIALKETHNFLHLAGLYTVHFLCIATAALLAADTLAGEISTGTIQLLATKPISRESIVLGKWLGFALLLAAYLLFIAGGVMLSVWLQSGYVAARIASGIGLMYMESLLMMSTTLFLSSRLTALASGATIFGLYGLAFIGGWVEQFGSFVQSETAVQVGIISSLVYPTEALWRRAAYEMQSPLSGVVGITPFVTISIPSNAMVVYALFYMALMIALALHQFNQRDL